MSSAWMVSSMRRTASLGMLGSAYQVPLIFSILIIRNEYHSAGDVEANAVAAALHDPRFAPLNARELNDTVVEVTVLSAPAALPAADEAELLARLRPGVDGVVLSINKKAKIKVEGEKTWDDGDNQDGKRPTSIKVHLLADGHPIKTSKIGRASCRERV